MSPSDSLQPEHTAALSRALALYRQGCRAEAADALNTLIESAPAWIEPYLHLGAILKDDGKLQDALLVVGRALTIDSNHLDALNLQGRLSVASGRLQDAEVAYRRALDVNPDYVPAMTNLGLLMEKTGRYDAAEAMLRQAIAKQPDRPLAYINLASLLGFHSRVDEAAACLRKAIDLSSDPALAVRLALLMPTIPHSAGDLARRYQSLGEILDRLEVSGVRFADPVQMVGATTFNFGYHGVNVRPVLERIARFFLATVPGLTWTAPHCRHTPRPPFKRIRVAFVSQYFWSHSVGKLFQGVIAGLDRQRFHVTVVRVVPPHPDATAAAIAQAADTVVDLSGSLADMRWKIASLEADILFYTDIGSEPLTYFLAFARLAPVQCVAVGHPHTTGIPNMDYWIATRDMAPIGIQDQFSERVIRLADGYLNHYRPEVPETGPDRTHFGLQSDWTVYLYGQSLFKLHPDFDPVLIELLRRDPQGRLVIVEGISPFWHQFVMKRLGSVAPDVIDRIVVVPRQSMPDFLGLMQVADAVLDSPHFSGGMTTYDACAAAIPVVTWPGELLQGRMTYAIYAQLGVFDTVVNDAESYVRVAMRLAHDRNWRASVSERIKAGWPRLFGVDTGLRQLETFFVDAVVAAQHGEALKGWS